MEPQSFPTIPALITRPEPQASRFASALEAHFPARLRILCAPVLRARFLPPQPGGAPPDGAPPFGALVFTSQTGVLAAVHLREAGAVALPTRAYCVGPRTAQIAREHGFAPICGGGDALRLFALLDANRKDAPFLHLHGRDTGQADGQDLAAQLSAAGIAAQGRAVYAQEPAPLSAEAGRLLAGSAPVLLPLFSPRSVRVLFADPAMRTRRAPVICAALSPAVAQELPQDARSFLRVAVRPDAPALLEAVKEALRAAARDKGLEPRARRSLEWLG